MNQITLDANTIQSLFFLAALLVALLTLGYASLRASMSAPANTDRQRKGQRVKVNYRPNGSKWQ